MSTRLSLEDLPPRYRRRLFIDLIAEPKGYKFTEIITPDSKDEIREWKRLAKQAGRSEKL